MIFVINAMDSMSLSCLPTQPIFIMILRIILEENQDAVIYMIAEDASVSAFCTEITRWFDHTDNITVVPFITSVLSDAISWIAYTRKISPETDLIVMDCAYPLLSSSTLSLFLSNTSPGENSMLCAKIRPSGSHDIIAQHSPLSTVYAGVFRCTIGNFPIDIIKSNAFQFFMPMSTATRECVPVKTVRDRAYAEHISTETKHAMFLHQCYALWKKFGDIEEKIQNMELKLNGMDRTSVIM